MGSSSAPMWFRLIVGALCSTVVFGNQPPKVRLSGPRWGIPFSQWLRETRGELIKKEVAVLPNGETGFVLASAFLNDGSDCIVQPHERSFLPEDAVVVFCRYEPGEPCLLAGEYTLPTINSGEGEE